jgi:hypothetical protein
MLYAPIALGAYGVEDDSGIDAFRPGGLFEALPIFADVALILFTRCPMVASQEGRFA